MNSGFLKHRCSTQLNLCWGAWVPNQSKPICAAFCCIFSSSTQESRSKDTSWILQIQFAKCTNCIFMPLKKQYGTIPPEKVSKLVTSVSNVKQQEKRVWPRKKPAKSDYSKGFYMFSTASRNSELSQLRCRCRVKCQFQALRLICCTSLFSRVLIFWT